MTELQYMIDSFFYDTNTKPRYPHYDIVQVDENSAYISIALAGFRREDISVMQDGRLLIVKGLPEIAKDVKYIHKGISTKPFTIKERIEEFSEVKEVSFIDGILKIEVQKNIPEKMKPKEFEIK